MRWPWTRRPYTALASLDAIAESAVALAIDPDYGPSLKMEAMQDGSARTTMAADRFFIDPPPLDHVVISKPDPDISETRPEYHLALSKRMVSAFDASEAKIMADMETESDRHSKLMADLTMELDDVRRVRAAYVKVGEVLGSDLPDADLVGAIPAGNVDPVALAETGAKIAATRRRKPADQSRE